MKTLLAGFLSVVFIGLSVQAQVGAGKNSQGKRIEDADHGYSFTAPANWSAEKSEGKCAGVILANPAETINIVVKPHHSDSLASFFKNESNLAGQGFKQVGDVKELANEMKYVRVSKITNGQNALVDIIFIPFSSQGGATVMNITPTEQLAEEAMKEAVNIVKSFRYSAPQSQQNQPRYSSEPSPPTSVNSLFASKRLYAEGNNSQTRIDLCPSGSYSKVSNFFFSGGTSLDEEYGRWSVQSSGGVYYLILISGTGEQTNYQINGQTGSSVTLNNRRYSMEYYNGCR